MTKKLPASVRRAQRSEIKRQVSLKKSQNLVRNQFDRTDKKPKIVVEVPEFKKTPSSPKATGISNDNKVKSKDPWSEVASIAMTWCKSQADNSGVWSWGEERAWSRSEWDEIILPKMNILKSHTWNQLINEMKARAKKGREVPLHHHQGIESLRKEAQDRWRELNMDEYDTLFRFRIGSKRRAWGVRIKSHFFLVWYERNHKIYPVKE